LLVSHNLNESKNLSSSERTLMTIYLKRRWPVILVALALCATPQLPASSHSAGASSRPNVLIIVTDDQRGGLSVMPNTRAWLRKGGTKFTNAFVTTPLCCPSRASIMTGRYAHNHHVFSNYGESANLIQQSTLQYYLQQAGYETAMYGKYMNGWDISQPPPYFNHYAMTVTSNIYDHGTWNVDGTVKTIPDYNTTYISNKARHFLNHAGVRSPALVPLPSHGGAPRSLRRSSKVRKRSGISLEWKSSSIRNR
jgi:hypothetical protein